MEKGKAVFVTVLITALLVSVDACLYALNTSSFTALTGVFIIYGFLRCSLDFYHWLCGPGTDAARDEKVITENESGAHNNQERGKKTKACGRPNRGGATTTGGMLNENH